jgi:hypothetical protein
VRLTLFTGRVASYRLPEKFKVP